MITLKKINIYTENTEFVLEHINSFNHATKRYYLTEDGLKENLQSYIPVLEQYEIDVSDDLWPTVITFLNRRGKHE